MKKINDRMLGNRIRLAREARGMTQEELGKALGWEQSNVSKLERGVRKQLRLDELMQVVDILSVSVASLLPEWFADGDGDEATILSNCLGNRAWRVLACTPIPV